MNGALLVAAKDLQAELNRKEAFIATLALALLLVLVPALGFEDIEQPERLAAGVLWTAFTLSSMLGLARGFTAEVDKGTLDALVLAPIERSSVYFGKFLANLALAFLVELVVLPLFGLFFRFDLGPWLAPLLPILVLGTVGLVGVVTFLSALASQARAWVIVLPILLLPALFPLLTMAVTSTERVLAGLPFQAYQRATILMAAYDAVVLTLAWMTFDHVLEE